MLKAPGRILGRKYTHKRKKIVFLLPQEELILSHHCFSSSSYPLIYPNISFSHPRFSDHCDINGIFIKKITNIDIVVIDYLVLWIVISISIWRKCDRKGLLPILVAWGNSNSRVLCQLSFYSLKRYFLKAHHYMNKGI